MPVGKQTAGDALMRIAALVQLGLSDTAERFEEMLDEFREAPNLATDLTLFTRHEDQETLRQSLARDI